MKMLTVRSAVLGVIHSKGLRFDMMGYLEAERAARRVIEMACDEAIKNDDTILRPEYVSAIKLSAGKPVRKIKKEAV